MSTQLNALRPLDGFVEQFVAAQMSADRVGAIKIVESALHAGFSVSEVLLGIVQPAQYELGNLWQRNEISVVDEHVGTAISQFALSWLYQAFPRVSTSTVHVLVACVEGESHEIGARIVADLCELNGIAVTYLGTNVPSDSLIAFIERVRPDAVLLSVTMTWNVPTLVELVQRINELSPTITVVAGGLGLQWLESIESTQVQLSVFADPLEAISQLGRRLPSGDEDASL